MSGMAYGPEFCAIFVDPENPVLANDTRRRMAANTVHEVHHVLRIRAFNLVRGSGWCGGEVLALEGLATQTELFLPNRESEAVRGVLHKDVTPMLERLSPIVGEFEEDTWAWIYELNGLPETVFSAVYSMGHHVVGRYLEHTGQNPVEALTVPWQDIWKIGNPN